MKRALLSICLRAVPCLLAASILGCAAGTIPPVYSEAERLALARRMVDQRKYLAAIELLKGYIQNNAGSGSVDQAIYLLGESYLKSREWPSAAVEFERLMRDYPESDSTPAASFRLGEALFGQARPPDFDQEYTVKAIDQWRNYRRDHEGHWLNEEADRRIAMARGRLGKKLLDTGTLYLQQRLPGPARSYFERIEREFEPSLLRAEGELGLAVCDAMQGRRDEALQRLAAIAECARDQLRLDRVLFVPAAQPPHKRGRVITNIAARIAMTRLAVRGNPAFRVLTLEANRPGPSYTVDTLRELKREFGRARLWLVMGEDSLDEFHTWLEPAEILRLSTLAVARRHEKRARTRRRPEPVWLGMPVLDVSSTGIRDRLCSGFSARYLVPDPVLRYAARHRLYVRGKR